MIECGNALLQKSYKLKIFNTINFSKSMKYNPMAYIHSEKDILKLVTALMTNTKGEGQGGDPFWDKAERLLLVSLIAYLHYEAPVEEQNFATLLEMLNTMQVSEDDETYQNPVDLLFEDLGKKTKILCRAAVQTLQASCRQNGQVDPYFLRCPARTLRYSGSPGCHHVR